MPTTSGTSIQFPVEYLEEIDRALLGQMFASRYQTGGEEFVSNRTVMVPDLSFPDEGIPNDYDGFQTENTATLKYTAYELPYDKQCVFRVDAVDDIDVAGLLTANEAGEYDRTVFAPWADKIFFRDTAALAGGTSAVSVTSSNVKAEFRKLRTHLRKYGLSAGDVYMSSDALAALEEATTREWGNEGTITDSVGNYNGFDLFEDAGERLPDGCDMLAIAGGITTVRYVMKRAVTYTFAPGQHTTGDDWLTQIRRVFGNVVRLNKRPGIYVVGSAAGSIAPASDRYVLTADTAIDSTKTYYTRSGSGTTADPYTYAEVASPVVANIGTYYEKVA